MMLFGRIFTDQRFEEVNEKVFDKLRLDTYDLIIVGITLLIVFTVSILNERGVCIRESLAKRHIALRWAVLYGLILFIIVFGAYGGTYAPVDPMYAQF